VTIHFVTETFMFLSPRMCYQPSELYSGCGCPRSRTDIIKCAEADLVDNYCTSLRPFEDRVGNRICWKHYQELVAAVKSLGKKNGMLHEARRAAKLERLEESVYTDGDGETEDVSDEDDFGALDGGWPKALFSGGLDEVDEEQVSSRTS
jgi:hypothetical protein